MLCTFIMNFRELDFRRGMCWIEMMSTTKAQNQKMMGINLESMRNVFQWICQILHEKSADLDKLTRKNQAALAIYNPIFALPSVSDNCISQYTEIFT